MTGLDTAWSHELDTPVVLLGMSCALACAIPGTLLVVRRMSMMSEAIAHAALPGVVAAVLLTGRTDPVWMFAGAVVVGILTSLLVDVVQRVGRLESGASMGVVFTTLFAAGLLLVRQHADHVRLDPHMVLFGNLDLAPFGEVVEVLGREVPQATVTLVVLALVELVLLALFWRPLVLSSFDEDHARVAGVPSRLVRHGLVVMASVTTVAAFEAVGVIMVVGMMVVPGLIALLLSQRLPVVLVLAAALGCAGVLLGHLAAIHLPATIAPWLAGEAGQAVVDSSSAGMITLTYGVMFGLALLLSPGQGLLAGWWCRRRPEETRG